MNATSCIFLLFMHEYCLDLKIQIKFHLWKKYSDMTEDDSSQVLHVTLVNLGFHSGPQIFAVVFFGTTE